LANAFSGRETPQGAFGGQGGAGEVELEGLINIAGIQDGHSEG
jgi:hypothetical protein